MKTETRISPTLSRVAVGGVLLDTLKSRAGALVYFVADELTDEVILQTYDKAAAEELFTALTVIAPEDSGPVVRRR